MRPAKISLDSCPHCSLPIESARGTCERHLPTKMGKKKSGTLIKRTPEDAKASDRIRARDGWMCTVCGSTPHRSGLHAMHCYERGRDSLYPGCDKHSGENCCPRHDDDNMAAGCWPCHRRLDKDKALKYAHFRGLLGEERYGALTERATTLRKRVKRAQRKTAAERSIEQLEKMYPELRQEKS